MSDSEQACSSCAFYHPTHRRIVVPGKFSFPVGQCRNEESVWHKQERRPDEGVFCPDWKDIGPWTGGVRNA